MRKEEMTGKVRARAWKESVCEGQTRWRGEGEGERESECVCCSPRVELVNYTNKLLVDEKKKAILRKKAWGAGTFYFPLQFIKVLILEKRNGGVGNRTRASRRNIFC